MHRGHGPAANAEEISVGNLTARYEPVENRAPSRDVAAKAIAALTVSEKNFGAREVKGGLRVGLLSVAELFVTIGDGGVEGA